MHMLAEFTQIMLLHKSGCGTILVVVFDTTESYVYNDSKAIYLPQSNSAGSTDKNTSNTNSDSDTNYHTECIRVQNRLQRALPLAAVCATAVLL